MAKKLSIQNPAALFMSVPPVPPSRADLPAAPAQNPAAGKKHGVQLLVDTDLYERAKQYAAQNRCTLTKLIHDLIAAEVGTDGTSAPLNPATRFMSVSAGKRFVAPPRKDVRRQRVHMNLDPELHERIKACASARSLSVNKLINDLLAKVCP